jgi:GNAT superfamily N-acetyltransferase
MRARCAELSEAAGAADVLRRSITELCADDYRHDPAVLARWLANKTAANLERWIVDPARSVCVVMDEAGRLAAVGMVVHDGEVQLNYVAPEARFGGASKRLLAHMEEHLRRLGVRRATLASSQVARRFYRAAGYAEGEEVESLFGTLPGVRMTKDLG